MKISQKALDLIKDFEGIDEPGEWPGGASGVTIGYGYDLGYESNFKNDWRDLIPDNEIARLCIAIGVKGESAQALARRFTNIQIHEDAASKVLENRTIPKYEAQTLAAFPRSELLNPDALGALVSLVYNRGGGMDGDRRSEMREIRNIISNAPNPNSEGALTRIADQFEAMCRLWPRVKGLRRRRLAEANLIRNDL